MKKFYFIEKRTTPMNGESKAINREQHIYQLKNSELVYCCRARFSTGSTQGSIAEAFQSLMENGYIPKKYYKSSGNTGACGDGYFYGEVCKYYDIKELS